MDQKPLGRSGQTISAIGLGTVTFGREINEEDSYRVMDHALQCGVTFFDTAEAYGGGQSRRSRKANLGVDDEREVSDEISSSERIIGDWMQKNGTRDQVTLCSKVGTGGSPENIRQALDASLARLKTDCVDIYKMHAPDKRVPIAETLGALTEQVKAGRVKTIGGSNYSAAQLRESLDASAAHGYARFEVLQPPYNLVTREFEADLFPLCQAEQLAITPFSPLAAGFLSGKYTPDRDAFPGGSRFHISPAHADLYFSDDNFETLERLRSKAAALDVPMVQLAMAWAMTHPAVTSVLIGARTIAHIDNAVSAWHMHLDADLRAEVSAFAPAPV